jgi:2-aminoethylphosphonate-pyruvate transaminase
VVEVTRPSFPAETDPFNRAMTDKLLFTPGPLNTSRSVKEAMLRDLGSRDAEFITLVRHIRAELLSLAGVAGNADRLSALQSSYEAVLIQGSGTFGVESVLSSVIPSSGKLLALTNGAYGERIIQIAARHRIPHEILRWPENQPLDPALVRGKLESDPALAGVTHIAAVHCETSTGILNPIESLAEIAAEFNRTFIVDAMSSFGGIPIDLSDVRIHFLISSANKCIQGVPGFSFVLALRESLTAAEGTARTLSLDLYEQWRGLEASGQFRFTPPTHALLAFAQALKELRDEGGIPARAQRYAANHKILIDGMRALGFVPFLERAHQSPIINAFHYPADPSFHFQRFYELLSRDGMVIYPGKLTQVECFRLGNIGHLFPADMQALLESIKRALAEMGFLRAPKINDSGD